MTLRVVTSTRTGTITGLIALALIVWVLFESRRFKGPPIGDEVKKRAAAIAAAERAVGEKA